MWFGRKKTGQVNVTAAIVYADGMLYFRNEDGIMNLLEASPKG